MNCPLCHAKLKIWVEDYYTNYSCIAPDCINDDMPRYIAKYNNYPTYLLSRALMLGKYHIVIDYINKTTTISVLMACLLLDSVTIHKVLSINLKRPYDIIHKIKTLMIFS